MAGNKPMWLRTAPRHCLTRWCTIGLNPSWSQTAMPGPIVSKTTSHRQRLEHHLVDQVVLHAGEPLGLHPERGLDAHEVDAHEVVEKLAVVFETQ